MKGLISLKNLPKEKIQDLVHLAIDFKNGKSVSYKDKRIAALFFENSTRTLYSFQMAMLKLGIVPIVIQPETSSTKKGESLYDTVKTLEVIGFDGIVIRHSQTKFYNELMGIDKMPIFNAGDGMGEHPTQTLLDLVTIYEEYGHFEGLKITILGDIRHSRVAHGNIEIMERLGMDVSICGPECFIDGSAKCISMSDAIKNSDIVMLLRVQFEREATLNGMSTSEYLSEWGMTEERAKAMKETAIIMHPSPINRGVEIASEVAEHKKSRIFRQAENGVFARMAAISMVLDNKI